MNFRVGSEGEDVQDLAEPPVSKLIDFPALIGKSQLGLKDHLSGKNRLGDGVLGFRGVREREGKATARIVERQWCCPDR